MSWHTDFFPYVMDTHVTEDYMEWGSAPHGSLITCDLAHRGELITAVVGESVTTPRKQVVYFVLRCELCICTHIWPLPSEDDLAAYYAQKFYAGPAEHEVAQHERDREWYENCLYGPVLNQCHAILVTQGVTHIPRVLDIGAGSGLLLDTAKQYGWYTMGIEPDNRQCEALAVRGHQMCAGTLTAHKRCVERWGADVVTLFDTLEHQSNPESFLLDCYDLMHPGALLVISCPNDWSPLQMAVCQKYDIPPYWILAPMHTHFFSPKCLQLLVRRCGFSLCDMRSTFPLERKMLEDNGACYVGNQALWRQYSDEKMEMELAAVRNGSWHELVAIYRSNLAHRIGRSILCIARKV